MSNAFVPAVIESGGEDALVERIVAALGSRNRIGDDVAEIEGLVVSTDQTIEGQHVSRSTASLAQIGWKALARALSDLAGSSAVPRGALVALAAPSGLADDEVVELYTGIAEAAGRFACPILGGDISRSDTLALTVTVLGAAAGQPLRRIGARVGDVVAVSGSLGASEAGRLLLAGTAPGLAPSIRRELCTRHLRPVPRLDLRERLDGLATSGMDLSDGLAADAPRLARQSGVVLELRLQRLPVAPGVAEVAHVLDTDPATFAAASGEDYELLVTLPSGVPLDDFTAIGRVREAVDGHAGAVFLDPAGEPVEVRGFDHRRTS